MIKFKWLSFLSKDENQLQAYESWTVRWTSFQYGYSIASGKEQAEVFTSEKDAKTFAESLKAARILLKDSELIYEIKKN